MDRHSDNRVSIEFNGRALHQPLTGVQRCVREWHRALSEKLNTLAPADRRWAGGMKGHLWEQSVLPLHVNEGLLWSPGNTGPLAIRDQVVTIHDASTLDHPEWFSRSFASVYQFLLPQLANRVLGISTVSEFSKERLIHHFGISEERIHVVPNGVGKGFQPVAEEKIEEVKATLEICRPYFLYVGSIDPRKNLHLLLNAWKAASLKEFELLIVGERNPIFERFSLGDSESGIRFLGRIPNELLVPLYCGAHAATTPSLYEGFGLPILESLACGTPCLASDIPAHREVAGESALLIPPDSISDWAETIRSVAVWSPSERGKAGELGLKRAAEFSWEASAAGHLKVLTSYVKKIEKREHKPRSQHQKSAEPSVITTRGKVTILGREYLLGRKFGRIFLWAIVVRDLLLGWAFAVKKSPFPPIESLSEICICKYDHMGDLMMTTPLLKLLREEAPLAKISLIVCQTSLDLGNILLEQGLVDKLFVYTPFLLNRCDQRFMAKFFREWDQFWKLSSYLRKQKIDLFLDLRIHSPNAWFLAIWSNAKFRAGFGLRGMSASYHALLPYDPKQSIPQVYLDSFASNRETTQSYQKPILKPVPFDSHLPAKFPSEGFVVVQIVAGEALRNVDAHTWLRLLEMITLKTSIVLLGDQLTDSLETEFSKNPRIISLIQKTTIREALAIISHGNGVVSVDSFAAHVGLAYDKPVAVIMKSGFSIRQSYPVGSANLRFFDGETLREQDVCTFLGIG